MPGEHFNKTVQDRKSAVVNVLGGAWVNPLQSHHVVRASLLFDFWDSRGDPSTLEALLVFLGFLFVWFWFYGKKDREGGKEGRRQAGRKGGTMAHLGVQTT